MPRAVVAQLTFRALAYICFAAAMACFVIMAWAFDWRAGMGVLGGALLILTGVFLVSERWMETRAASERVP